jgi:hypothetical protein
MMLQNRLPRLRERARESGNEPARIGYYGNDQHDPNPIQSFRISCPSPRWTIDSLNPGGRGPDRIFLFWRFDDED